MVQQFRKFLKNIQHFITILYWLLWILLPSYPKHTFLKITAESRPQNRSLPDRAACQGVLIWPDKAVWEANWGQHWHSKVPFQFGLVAVQTHFYYFFPRQFLSFISCFQNILLISTVCIKSQRITLLLSLDLNTTHIGNKNKVHKYWNLTVDKDGLYCWRGITLHILYMNLRLCGSQIKLPFFAVYYTEMMTSLNSNSWQFSVAL